MLGLLIGFYGNWYATLLSKLGESEDAVVWLILGISAISLFVYCVEITHQHARRSVFRGFHVSRLVAIVHLAFTYTVYYMVTGVFLTNFMGVGCLLWLTIIWYELH